MEQCKISNMYTLEETIAKDYLAQFTYPWEALAGIGDYIKELGKTLNPDVYEQKGEDIWVAKSAAVAPTACLNGPLIIDENAEIRHCAFIRGNAIVGKGTVVDSLIYTVAFANEDFSISQQDTFTWLCIGIKNADEKQREKVAEVAKILKGADIDYKDEGDIEVEIWRKYILNCAFNVMTAFYDNTIGELRSDQVKAQQYETLVWEAASVGRARGVALTDEHINEVIHKFRHVHADNATSSLQRDYRICKKQTELETFSGYIVKEAKRLGVEIPLSEKMYQGLREMAEKF